MFTPTIAERWKSQAKSSSMVGGGLVSHFYLAALLYSF